MNIFHTLILSLVEGITEFLPVSSTGHLILVSNLLKIPASDFVKSFEIFIQLGAILSVVIIYWKKMIRGFGIWKRIVTAFIPAAVIGLVFYKSIKHYLLGNSGIVVVSLFLGGIILIFFEKFLQKQEKKSGTIDSLNLKNALLIGVFQSVAIIPGVSRSAATIVGGMFLGLKREEAVEFSFFLAVPTMFAATGLDLVKSGINFSSHEILLLGAGFIGSFIAAFFAIKFFLNFVKKNSLVSFGIYRIFLAVVYWVLILR